MTPGGRRHHELGVTLRQVTVETPASTARHDEIAATRRRQVSGGLAVMVARSWGAAEPRRARARRQDDVA